MALVHEFRAAGVQLFLLRPIAEGTEDMSTLTRLILEKLIPEIDALNRIEQD